MFDNEFDELFRSRLKDHPSVVPDDMWQRINGKTDVRRGGSRWRWYFIGSVILVAGLVVGPRFWTTSHARPIRQKLVASQMGPARQNPDPSHVGIARQNSGVPGLMPSRQDLVSSPVATSQMKSARKELVSSLGATSHFASAGENLSAPRVATSSHKNSTISKSPGSSPQTHSVSELSIPRSGSVPRSQSGPGFFARSPSLDGRTSYNWQPSFMPVPRTFLSPYAPRPKGKAIPCPAPDDLRENSGWFIEAYFSPDILFTSRPQNFSYSAGLRLGKNFTDRFSATVGLQFSHISLKTTPDSIPAQQFQNIDVPILFGYQFGSGNLNAIIHAGAIWNLHSQPVGPDYGISYRNNTGMAVYFGLDILKALNSHWSLFAEPHFRYQLTNRSVNLVQSPDLGGVSFGVRYNFTRRAGVR